MSCPVEDIFFGGARGGGKTDGGIGKVVSHANEFAKASRSLIIRHTYPQLEELQRRMHEIVTPLGAKWAAGKRTYVFPNGAITRLRSLESEKDAENFQGHNYSLIVVDEAGNFANPAPIDKIRATLRSAEGARCQLVCTGNPGGAGHQWLKERYVMPSQPLVPHYDEARSVNRVFIPSKVSDNPALLLADPKYLNRIRASGPGWLVKAWLDGDWNATLAGKLITMSDFGRYATQPAEFTRTVLSVDCAVKGNEWNSNNSAQLWGEKDGFIYRLHEWCAKANYGELKRSIRSLANSFRPNVLVIEGKGNGVPLISELREDPEFTVDVIEITPHKDKVLRMDGELPAIQSHRVLLPKSAPWLPPWETEVSLFPEIKDKDRVDAMSQALWYLRTQTRTRFRFDFGPGSGNLTPNDRFSVAQNFGLR